MSAADIAEFAAELGVELLPWQCEYLERAHPAIGEPEVAPEREPEPAVAGKIAGAGEHEVAEAGEAHQRFRARAECGAEAQHFGEAARDETGTRVEAHLHAVGDAGRDREHVLHRAAELGTENVVAGVCAEHR